MRRQLQHTNWILAVTLLVAVNAVHAAPIADIRNTKHNFSATVIPDPSIVTRTAHATSESQICAFCHTPHGATPEQKAPLWNRQLSSATYTLYNSNPVAGTSLDATDLGNPSGKSKLCLSCHDGTIALGAVNVLNRQQNPQVGMTGTSGLNPGTIPEGLGRDTGFTRRLGVDLTNDHPISFTFDSAQAARDGELYDPAQVTQLRERVPGTGPALPEGNFLPLERDATGAGPKVECISCHDPHVRSDVPGENIKFLRVNRFQQQTPLDGSFDKDTDIICLGCHNKAGWVGSAHANPAVGDERYQDAAADLREFPRNLRVWQAACLNCHDPHTVQGARRILREGTDSTLKVDPVTGGKYKQGGNAAVEQVCYACHSNSNLSDTAQTLQGQVNPDSDTNFEVPDIKTDFTTMLRHMPIASTDQLAGTEVHAIGTGTGAQGAQRGKDFVEDPANLGKGNLTNRHAECTDCHNPHRVMKNRLFNADNSVPDAAGTHPHKPADLAATGGIHTNLASGVLRGIWGVEPSSYPSSAFGSEPITFDVKRGDPQVGGSTAASAPYLTREYQVCFKCHSNYTYNTPPGMGYTSGLTPAGTNSAVNYTNQAMEYQSPDDHKGEGTSGSVTGAYNAGGGCSTTVIDSDGNPLMINGRLDPNANCSDYVTNNHRAWHPVVKETGRTPAVRNADANDWRSPFNLGVGIQTMYCTDCHGSVTPGDTVEPVNGENGYPWGPHGSNANFLLKGAWNDQTGENTTNFADLANTSNHLCFRCHDPNQYTRDIPGAQWPAPPPPAVQASGFKVATGSATGCLPFKTTNLHVGHASFVTNFRCTYCHVAVPHGWKNKVFLANLNDVGLEAALPAGTQVRTNTTARYYNGPYYNGSVLKVRAFARSGEWVDANCGSAGTPGNGIVGFNWMNGSNESCANLP